VTGSQSVRQIISARAFRLCVGTEPHIGIIDEMPSLVTPNSTASPASWGCLSMD
jgi:hypothetical protein